jgi:hypothetical protein
MPRLVSPEEAAALLSGAEELGTVAFCERCGQATEVDWDVEDASFDHAFGTQHAISAMPFSMCCEKEVFDDPYLSKPFSGEYDRDDSWRDEL